MSLLKTLLHSHAPAATVLIRIMVGAVFLSEGIQKFLFPEARGAGRFERMGYESAEMMAPFVASFEILCGVLVLAGLGTRFVAIPLIVIMLTAITTTKIPILYGQDMWGFHVRELSTYGFWSMAHESRTDFSMLLGSVFLLIVGGGPWAADRWVVNRLSKSD